MKTVTREQWTTALRSGDYKQGKYRLYTAEDDTYCCLGVLAHLAGEKCNGPVGQQLYIDGVGCIGNLPIELLHQVGLNAADESNLIRMNDSENKDFKAIAEKIDNLFFRKFT